jgi:hypothetical protein
MYRSGLDICTACRSEPLTAPIQQLIRSLEGVEWSVSILEYGV